MSRTAVAPAKSPKWRRRPEHRPQQIIEAALEVFGEFGLAKTRLQDIAERAGVSKGTIYLYFPNKEELFREMIRQTAVAAIVSGEKTTAAQGTPTEQLCAAMRGYWKFVRSSEFSTIYRLVLGELHQFPDLAKFYADEVVSRVLSMLTAIIQRGVDNGEFRDLDPKVAARMLMALIIMNAIWRDEHTGVPLLCHKKDEEVFRELAHFYLHSLTTPAAVHSQADGGDAGEASFIPFDND